MARTANTLSGRSADVLLDYPGITERPVDVELGLVDGWPKLVNAAEGAEGTWRWVGRLGDLRMAGVRGRVVGQ